MNRDRAGFTIAELIVVAVLGSLLLMAVYQILLTNQRTYRANSEQVQGQQAARMVLDLLTADLREMNVDDITGATPTAIGFDVATQFGVVCDVVYSPQYNLRVVKYEEWFDPTDDVVVFADNDEDISDDDTWVDANVTSADTTSITCGGRQAHDLKFTGQDAKFLSDSVRVGAPLRSLVERRYTVDVDGSGTYWVYRDGDLFAGPIASGGLQFTYFDDDENTTTTLADIHAIQITVTAEDGTTMSTKVYPRN